MLIIGEAVCEEEDKWELSMPSVEFFCESKTLLKKKSINKKLSKKNKKGKDKRKKTQNTNITL